MRAPRRILITGGAGFIGSRLARALREAGDDVFVFDNLHAQVHGAAGAPVATLDGVRLIRGDVRDRESLAAAVASADPDLVFHLAAETGTGQSYDLPARYCDVNVSGAANLVECLRRLPERRRRVVLAGSRAVYGEGAYGDGAGRVFAPPPRRPEDLARGAFLPADDGGRRLTPLPTREDLAPSPASIYASTKLMQEYVLRQGLAGSPTRLCVLRLQNVYGPGQSLHNAYTGILSIFARQILDGQELDLYEDGRIVRDFVYVDDVVRAFERAAVADDVDEEPVNIGSGRPAELVGLASALLRCLGRPPDLWSISGRFRPGDVRHALADIGRARTVLGWEPRVTLEPGLQALADWVLEERAHGRI